MQRKRKIYIYPNTEALHQTGSNSYISNLIFHLGQDNDIINDPTRMGLLHVFTKIFKCDVLYFNWIEDLPHKRYGYIQIPFLIILLVISKIRNVRIIWFIHNVVSHNRESYFVKKLIVYFMRNFSDVILSHASDVQLKIPMSKFYSFDHPVESYNPIQAKEDYQFDLLIWGSVAPYKGIAEFVDYVKTSSVLKGLKILIAGKFHSQSYYDYAATHKTENISIVNELLPESNLIDLFSTCRFVLFTYNSPSVLSSASLCKTLSYGKEIIGPNRGAFKELGSKGFIYTYDSFAALEHLLSNLTKKKVSTIDRVSLANYIQQTSWREFGKFLNQTMSSRN